jgi:hypothetical protein
MEGPIGAAHLSTSAGEEYRRRMGTTFFCALSSPRFLSKHSQIITNHHKSAQISANHQFQIITNHHKSAQISANQRKSAQIISSKSSQIITNQRKSAQISANHQFQIITNQRSEGRRRRFRGLGFRVFRI